MASKTWSKQLSPDARSVLEAGLGVSAPAGTKQAVWGALAAKLPAAGAAGAAASGVSALSVFKALAVGLALGAGTATGIAGVQSVTHGASPRAQAPGRSGKAQPLAPPRTAPAPGPTPAASVVVPSAPTPIARRPLAETETETAPSRPTPAATRTSALAAFPAEAAAATPPPENAIVVESRRLAEVRAALQARDARSALARLDQLDRDFPRGVLLQERDALRIESLLVIGDRERARELARRFLERNPRSPHAAAAERALR